VLFKYHFLCTTQRKLIATVRIRLHIVIPFWTGYNSSLSEYRHEYSVVSYAPIVDAKQSDMSTVYTTMRRCQEMTKSLGQAYSIQRISKALGKRFGIPHTFGFENVRHDVCE
jgi:hypothetical protein